MARASRNVFTTVKTEGGLLPPDFLQHLIEGAKGIDGLTPESYHLAAGEKPNEAASRSWNRLQTAWAAFQTASEGLREEDAGTGLTRERWLLPLFSELGYGRVQAAKTFEIDGKSYPISHLWQQTPIHLIGRNVELDRRSPGVIGAAKTTPHGLMQEFLNRHEGHLWGFVSNGLKLRILRDNKSLTRQAYVEFDLAGMMDGQVYSDFALLWLLCHQSRVEADGAEQCWLEKWADAARQQGTRALDQLRDGVQKAIETLGRAFLAYPANKVLVENLREGKLDKQDYYRQLLRTVYRLIFLFVAEDRDLLLTAKPNSKERERYLRHYSVSRLRTLAERRRGSPHADQWQALRLVFAKLSSETGCPELGIPALGSFLWSDKATPDLDLCELANADLLESVRSLVFTVDGKLRRAIDYRNLGAEELGSVYESLLELQPDLNADAPTFALSVVAGSEKKTTGTYYTRSDLIDCLLDSALEPVLQAAMKQSDPENAILDLRVCDPACGSGHFLIAAAHRMASRLAAVRTGDEEPSPEAIRKSLRDVVGRCLYGVDINPMAVELCKVNLWLEALEPGRPLSFVEHRILCGNSLLGTTPQLLARGVPDEAFEPIAGDEKPVCQADRRRNKAERESGQGSLLLTMAQPSEPLAEVASAWRQLDSAPETGVADVRGKEAQLRSLREATGFRRARLHADAWCAAFLCVKKRDVAKPEPLTSGVVRKIGTEPESVPSWMIGEVERLASEFQVFHWYLAFPPLFAEGCAEEGREHPRGKGFDVVLGNPPWEKLQVEEEQFFAIHEPAIATLTGAVRKKAISALPITNPPLARRWAAHVRAGEAEVAFIRRSGAFPLTGQGKFNSYALFAELKRRILSPHGRMGCVVPTNIATDDTTKGYFQEVVDRKLLVSLFDFENRRKLFPAVHSSFRFCLLTVTGSEGQQTLGAEFAFMLHDPADLADEERRLRLTAQDILAFSPNTRTCPILPSRRDARLGLHIHKRAPALVNETSAHWNAWKVGLHRMINMTDDSGEFASAQALAGKGWHEVRWEWHKGEERMLPLYESKMLHYFDHRWASYKGADFEEMSAHGPHDWALPRYYVPASLVLAKLPDDWSRQWLVGWRDITRATDERTVIAAILPYAGVGHTCNLIFPVGVEWPIVACLVANLSAFALDYAARLKIAGTHLTSFLMKQLPVLLPGEYANPCPWEKGVPLTDWIARRVLELMYTCEDLRPFAKDLGSEAAPYPWNRNRRAELRAELDAAYFHLYAIEREDVDYILDSFPIAKKNDETKYGDYRTKLMILDAYDRMTGASDSRA